MAKNIPGLLGDAFGGGNSLVNLGIGLLANSGPSTQPINTGRALGQAAQFNQQQQLAFLQQRRLQQMMAEQQRQAEAQKRFSGLLSGTTMQQGPTRQLTGLGGEVVGNIPGFLGEVPTISTPQGQTEALGLLGQIAPQSAGAILGQMMTQQAPQERAEPAFIRELRALEDPTLSTEQRRLLREKIDSEITDEADSGDLASSMQALNAALQAESRIRELNAQTQGVERTRRELRVNARSTFRTIEHAAELNDRLKGTLLEAGVPFNNFAATVGRGVEAVKGLLGIGDAEARSLLNDYSEFVKATSSLQLQAARLQGTNANTNQRFDVLRDASAGVQTASGANDAIFRQMVQTILDTSEIEGVSLDDREAMERFLNPQGSPWVFGSEDDFNAAYDRGEVSIGDTVTINGQQFVVQP